MLLVSEEALTSSQKGAIVYSTCECTSAGILLTVSFLSATEIRAQNVAYRHYFECQVPIAQSNSYNKVTNYRNGRYAIRIFFSYVRLLFMCLYSPLRTTTKVTNLLVTV